MDKCASASASISDGKRSLKSAWPWIAVLFLIATVALLLFTTVRTRGLLWNSLRLSVAVAAFSVPVGAFVAWVIARTNAPGRRFLLLVLLTLLFMPLYLVAAGWEAGFGQLGWLRLARGRLGAGAWLSGWRGAIWVHSVAAVPWAALIVGLQLRSTNGDVEDAALLDARPLAVFLRVTMRQITTAVVAASVWIMVWVIGEMTVTDLFQVRTYAEELYLGFALDEPTPTGWVATAGTSGWTSVLLVVWLALGLCLVGARLHGVVRDAPPSAPPRQLDLGWLRWPIGLLAAVTVVGILAMPLFNLVYKAGLSVEGVEQERLRRWSLIKAITLFLTGPWRFREELSWSLVLAQLASASAVVAAVPLAWWACRRRAGAVLTAAIVVIALAIPGPLVGLAIVTCFTRIDHPWISYLYSQTVAAPWMALTVRSLPLVLAIVWLRFQAIPHSDLDAARLAGASGVRQLRLVVLPQSTAALGAAWLAGVIVALADLAASILVVPPGVTTVSIRIFGLVHSGVEDELASLGLATLVLFVSLALLLLWVARAVFECGDSSPLCQ
jgi:iron(III) transport system permease protein